MSNSFTFKKKGMNLTAATNDTWESPLAQCPNPNTLYIEDILFNCVDGREMNEEDRISCLLENEIDPINGSKWNMHEVMNLDVRKVALDTLCGHLYLSDYTNNLIKKVTLSENKMEIVCGGQDKIGYSNGPLRDAKFDGPQGLAFDPCTRALYVADSNNHVVRKILLDENKVDVVCGFPKEFGCHDGTPEEVLFTYPQDIILDQNSGCLYVTDSNSIREVNLNGVRPHVRTISKTD